MNKKNKNPILITDEMYNKTTTAIDAFVKDPSKINGNAARSRLTKLLTAYLNDWWFDGYNVFRDVFYDAEMGKLTVRMKIRNNAEGTQKNISYDVTSFKDVEKWLDRCWKYIHGSTDV